MTATISLHSERRGVIRSFVEFLIICLFHNMVYNITDLFNKISSSIYVYINVCVFACVRACVRARVRMYKHNDTL